MDLYNSENNYIKLMNKNIKDLLNKGLLISFKNPFFMLYLFKYMLRQKKAVKIREDFEQKGTHVPPFMIASITSSCNLKCKGCYSNVFNKSCEEELSAGRWGEIFNEAKDLGISFILLAGGEPFIRKDVLKVAGGIPEIIFPVFTNGTMINEKTVSTLKKYKNILPIVSIEGKQNQTDNRRGVGMFNNIISSLKIMKSKGLVFGISFTVTRQNYDIITHEKYIEDLISSGSKLFFYVEYVPVDQNSDDVVISQEQREGLDIILNKLRKKYSALFIAFPGDEKEFGGCLSSGRGFVHISHTGNLEPCPFAPYSDTNIKEMFLKDALQSEFLNKIRNSEEHLSETEHGCALYNKRDWVNSLLR